MTGVLWCGATRPSIRLP